jgi:DNA-binding NtrC family response regulator
LNVVPIHVPPLRERIEDVPFLSEEFMKRFSRKHGVPVKGFSDEAMHALKTHNWPGNVRELQNVIERAVILCGENGILEPEHLGLTTSPQSASSTPATSGSATSSTSNAPLPPLAEMEKRHILAALEQCKGNRTHAAKLLDVSIRTLRNKLHEYNGTSPKAEEEASVED